MAKWIYNSPLLKAVRQRDRNKLCAEIELMTAEEFRMHAYSGLLEACEQGWAGMAHILLEAGANPNETLYTYCMPMGEIRPDRSLLREASWSTPELVSLLLDYGADPNLAETFGFTPLMRAACNRCAAIVHLLLEAGAEVNAKDTYGTTALHNAATYGNCTTLKLLIENGAGINNQDKLGYTPIMNAAWRGNAPQVHTLLKYGASLTPRNKRGYNAIEIAARLGRHRVVQQLLKEGTSAIAKDPRGRTPLFHALCRYRQQPRHKERRAQVVRLLLKHGAKATEPIRHGITALHLAAWHGWVEVLRSMLEYAPQVDVRDCKGRTPLDYAVRRGKTESANLLRETITTLDAPSLP